MDRAMKHANRFPATRSFVALAFLGTLLLGPAANAQITHLDPSVRHAIMSGHYVVKYRLHDMPLAVMTAASAARDPKVAKSPLIMADAGGPFQATDVIVIRRLPGYRLIAAYGSDDYWIMHYEVGGVAHTYHVAVFAAQPQAAAAQFLWHARVTHALSGIDELRKLIRTGSSAIDDSYTRFY